LGFSLHILHIIYLTNILCFSTFFSILSSSLPLLRW
jgi:hypothetical protein